MEGDVVDLKGNFSEHELSTVDFELAKYKKSTGVAYILWFFLGGLGIHKFYIGKTGMGIFYLLLMGGLIVGTITGISKEMEPAMIIVGSCGLVLGILLLVDLFRYRFKTFKPLLQSFGGKLAEIGLLVHVIGKGKIRKHGIGERNRVTSASLGDLYRITDCLW